jgi:hypothetical protein
MMEHGLSLICSLPSGQHTIARQLFQPMCSRLTEAFSLSMIDLSFRQIHLDSHTSEQTVVVITIALWPKDRPPA